MKTKNKYEHTSMYYEKLEEKIVQEDKKIEQNALELASRLAEDHKPRLEGDNLSAYTQTIKGGYTSLWGESKKVLQTGLEDDLNAHDEQFIRKQKKTIEGKVAELKHNLRTKKVELERIIDDFPWRQYRIVIAILVSLGLLEGLVDTKAFQNFGDNFIVALIWGLGIGLSTSVACHVLPKVIRKGKTRWQRILIIWLITDFFVTIFYVIGMFRLNGLSNNLDIERAVTASHAGVTPWQFALINLLFFATSLLVSYFYLPDRKNELKRSQKQKFALEIKDCQKQIDGLEAESKSLDDEHQKIVAGRKQSLIYEQKLKEWIASLYEKTVGRFISENSIRRGDGVPDCFNGNIPPLFNPQNPTL